MLCVRAFCSRGTKCCGELPLSCLLKNKYNYSDVVRAVGEIKGMVWGGASRGTALGSRLDRS